MSSKLTYREAWKRSSGPESPREALVLILKGLCMGGADIIPGVSGGTIAFITGIYGKLIAAIRSFDMDVVKKILSLDFSGALAQSHLRFLFFLGTGIVIAIITMAGVMHHLLASHPVHIWSLFFGLIAASVFTIGRRIGEISLTTTSCMLLGALFAFVLVGLIPMQTPDELWFIFLCGSVAICAMILPGISGAFILLLVGKYAYVTGALKNPFALENLLIIGVFLCGACGGIVVFSRVLHYLLSHWRAATVSVLTGFMIGALRKVWPWKEALETVIVRGKTHVVSEMNVLPPAYDGDFWLAAVLMVTGAIFVLGLEFLSGGADEAG